MGNKTENNNIVLPQGRLAVESKNNNMIDENRTDIKSDVSSTRTDLEKEQKLKMKRLELRGFIKHPGEDTDFYYIDAEGNFKRNYNYSLLLNKSIRTVLTQSELRKEYLKACLIYPNFDDANKQLEGAGKMPLKNNTYGDTIEENVEGIYIPHSTWPIDSVNDFSICDNQNSESLRMQSVLSDEDFRIYLREGWDGLKKKRLEDFLKIKPDATNNDIRDEELRICRDLLKKKLLGGAGKMPIKNNDPKDTLEENNVEGINIPHTLRGAGPFDEIDNDIFNEENLRIKRDLLKRKLLEGGKISLENNRSLNNESNSESTIRIPKGGLLRKLTAPIYGISRHRILRDGDGVITLVAFSGCPLKCKYCINPQSNTLESAKYNLTAKELYHKVNVDNLYYLATNGGITFGGGEPLLYADYIREFSTICNERWNLNIETSLNVPLSEIKKVIPFIKEWIVDIKDVDPTVYGNYTSKTNEQVLENLKFLASSVDVEKVLIRTPRIPNYNTDDNVLITQEFLSGLGFIRFEKLTYTQDVEVERGLENDGVRGKVICEVLKKIRVLIAEDMRIDFTPNTCNHKTCSAGICPACEQELVDIQTRIIEKYKN